MSAANEDLKEKKLLGSGGYAFAKLTEQKELRANLGVPQIFLASVGRLSEDRFSRKKKTVEFKLLTSTKVSDIGDITAKVID
jgi:hypothetical protein